MKEKSISHTLYSLRKLHSYTQDYVASVLGIVRQTYSHYETGKRSPSPETLYKLASLYDISMEDLMQESVQLDPEIFYEPSAKRQKRGDLDMVIEYYNNPYNQKKFKYFSNQEKELYYYFNKLSDKDKRELIEIAKIKLN